ncbi:MAG: hypothetical protein NC225_09860 [Clostridium sp.]|nr:hypothetical protein [Clostridium sp.]MCM1399768.1 hypothetical protein [Clostridium sp.]MCM1459605.1 hypothetical protein [Bacteroides sp.]
MAMEISGSYNNYASYVVENKATGNARKKEAPEPAESKTERSAAGNKPGSTTDYMNTLKKLAPSVEFRTGCFCASDKSGKTLTINPKALEKMQNDPEFEKKMKELIGGVEKMEKISESFNKATGWTTVYRHSYIDENGNYCHIALTRNDRMSKLNEKLREERRQNAEKLIKKTREKSAKKKKELEELLEEKRAEKATEENRQEKAGEGPKEQAEGNEDEVDIKYFTKAEQMLAEKIADAHDGRIYVDDAEFRSFLEAVGEESDNTAVTAQGTDKQGISSHTVIGTNVDLTV